MSAVARQLQSRHHDVAMLSLPFIEPLARAANLPFIRFGEKEFPDDVRAEIVDTMGRLKGAEAREFAINAIAKAAHVRWRELPELVSVNGLCIALMRLNSSKRLPKPTDCLGPRIC